LFQVLCGSRKSALRSGFDAFCYDVAGRRRASVGALGGALTGGPRQAERPRSDGIARSFVPPDDAQTLETPKHTFFWGPDFLHLVAVSKESD
jgi:hypothetical protein